MVILQLSKEELQREIKNAVTEAIGDLHTPARDRLFSREEAATLLNVSLPTLSAWEKSGELHPKRYGNRVYFFESDLLKTMTMEKSFMREAGEASEKSSERYKRPGSSRHLDLQQGFESGAKWAKRYFETQLSPEIEKFQSLLIEERRSRQAVEKIMSGKTRELIDERDEAVKLLEYAVAVDEDEDHELCEPGEYWTNKIKTFLSKYSKP